MELKPYIFGTEEFKRNSTEGIPQEKQEALIHGQNAVKSIQSIEDSYQGNYDVDIDNYEIVKAENNFTDKDNMLPIDVSHTDYSEYKVYTVVDKSTENTPEGSKVDFEKESFSVNQSINPESDIYNYFHSTKMPSGEVSVQREHVEYAHNSDVPLKGYNVEVVFNPNDKTYTVLDAGIYPEIKIR
jgi:hypothetical protein